MRRIYADWQTTAMEIALVPLHAITMTIVIETTKTLSLL